MCIRDSCKHRPIDSYLSLFRYAYWFPNFTILLCFKKRTPPIIVLSWKVRVHLPLLFHTLCFFLQFGHKSRIYSVLSFQKPLPPLSFLSFFEHSLSFLHSIIPTTSFHDKLKQAASSRPNFFKRFRQNGKLSRFPETKPLTQLTVVREKPSRPRPSLFSVVGYDLNALEEKNSTWKVIKKFNWNCLNTQQATYFV